MSSRLLAVYRIDTLEVHATPFRTLILRLSLAPWRIGAKEALKQTTPPGISQGVSQGRGGGAGKALTFSPSVSTQDVELHTHSFTCRIHRRRERIHYRISIERLVNSKLHIQCLGIKRFFTNLQRQYIYIPHPSEQHTPKIPTRDQNSYRIRMNSPKENLMTQAHHA